jgi:hypothetical protein
MSGDVSCVPLKDLHQRHVNMGNENALLRRDTL